DFLGDADLRRVQRPRTDTTEQEGVTELRLAGGGVGEIAERAVERLDAGGDAGVDHLGDRVMPQVLLIGRTGRVTVCISQYFVFRMAAADARSLHGARSGEIGRAKAHAMHARG